MNAIAEVFTLVFYRPDYCEVALVREFEDLEAAIEWGTDRLRRTGAGAFEVNAASGRQVEYLTDSDLDDES